MIIPLTLIKPPKTHMQQAIKILLKRLKEYEAELASRGTTIREETERLRKAGLLIGQKKTDRFVLSVFFEIKPRCQLNGQDVISTVNLPRSHHSTDINSR